MERPESLFRVKSFPLRFITIIHPNLIARLESFDPTEDDGYVFFLCKLRYARCKPKLSLKDVANNGLHSIEVQLDRRMNNKEAQLVQFKGQYIIPIKDNHQAPKRVTTKQHGRRTNCSHYTSAPSLAATPIHCHPLYDRPPNEVGTNGNGRCTNRYSPETTISMKFEATPFEVHRGSTYCYPTP